MERRRSVLYEATFSQTSGSAARGLGLYLSKTLFDSDVKNRQNAKDLNGSPTGFPDQLDQSFSRGHRYPCPSDLSTSVRRQL